jgi:hypothetical protein
MAQNLQPILTVADDDIAVACCLDLFLIYLSFFFEKIKVIFIKGFQK